MSTIGDLARGALELLTPESNLDRLTFKKYKGETIAAALEEGNFDVEPEVSIALKVNPQSIDRKKAKITQKVQTNAPGRFIVFDWGTDLETISISGCTGNLLPTVVQSGTNPLDFLGVDNKDFNNLLYGKMTYFELLNMSPKYKTFKKLENLFKNFDADRDVLILELGEEIMRIFFTDFSFSIAADSPWNWKYNITVINLADLRDQEKREDTDFPKNGLIDLGA
jgi:hypothetical protein